MHNLCEIVDRGFMSCHVMSGHLKEKEADHRGASKGTVRPIAARGSRFRTNPLARR